MANPTVHRTGDAASSSTSMLVYGLAGSGKTPLATTIDPATLMIVCSEPGLKSIAKHNLPYVFGSTYKQAMDVIHWLKTSNETKRIKNVFFDSISALSENILIDRKKANRDPRRFSPETTAQTMEVVKEFIDLKFANKNIVMTCKAIESKKIVEVMRNGLLTPEEITWIDPFTVVPKLSSALPYEFDDVFYLSRLTAKDQAGVEFEYGRFTCRTNPMCYARNRVGNLETYELAHLHNVMLKNNGVC